jgi:hypothetical protein
MQTKNMNHHDLGSLNVSINCVLLHSLVCVVCWNFFGRRDANVLWAGERNHAFSGASGSRNHKATPHAVVISPNIRNSIYQSCQNQLTVE